MSAEISNLLLKIGPRLEYLSLIHRENRVCPQKCSCVEKKSFQEALETLFKLKSLEILSGHGHFPSEEILDHLSHLPSPEKLETVTLFTQHSRGSSHQHLTSILTFFYEANARLVKFATNSSVPHPYLPLHFKVLDVVKLLPDSLTDLCIPLFYTHESLAMATVSIISAALGRLKNLKSLFVTGSVMSERNLFSPLPDMIASQCPNLEKLGFRGKFWHSNREFLPLLKLERLEQLICLQFLQISCGSLAANPAENDKILEMASSMESLRSFLVTSQETKPFCHTRCRKNLREFRRDPYSI